MRRAILGAAAMSALLGAGVHRIADAEVVAPIEPPKVDKHETRQLRLAAEKRARKMAKRAARSRP